MSHADWIVDIEDAHRDFEADRDERRFRHETARLGFLPDEVDRFLSQALANQWPADGLLNSHPDRQQGAM